MDFNPDDVSNGSHDLIWSVWWNDREKMLENLSEKLDENSHIDFEPKSVKTRSNQNGFFIQKSNFQSNFYPKVQFSIKSWFLSKSSIFSDQTSNFSDQKSNFSLTPSWNVAEAFFFQISSYLWSMTSRKEISKSIENQSIESQKPFRVTARRKTNQTHFLSLIIINEIKSLRVLFEW